MNGMMFMMMAVVCALLPGCDYAVPLVETAGIPIDSKVVGVWQRSGANNKIERLVVLPLNRLEYLVVFPSGSKDAMFARGCLWRDEDTTLVQLDWIGTANGQLPKDSRTFQYVTYAVKGNSLTLRLLNPGVVAKDIASSDALAKAIADNKDNPKLFRDEMLFQRVNN